LLAALVSVPAVVLVAWVGLLFHRVLSLPTDQQKYGVTVLKQLVELARVGVEGKTTNRQSVGGDRDASQTRRTKARP
jgi:hypothetical protein